MGATPKTVVVAIAPFNHKRRALLVVKGTQRLVHSTRFRIRSVGADSGSFGARLKCGAVGLFKVR